MHRIGNTRAHSEEHARYHHPSSSKDQNPLICFQYLTRQLYEMTGSEVSTNKDEDGDMPPCIPLTSSRMSISRTADSHATHESHISHSTQHDSTCTPKRRRKEDGKGRIRFSPEKKTHWRESISRSGALLDQQQHPVDDEDEKSLLAGARINIPLSSIKDELSYSDSDSDASPAMRMDLRKEIIWEKLGNENNEGEGHIQESEDEGENFVSIEEDFLVNQTGLSQNTSLEVLSSPESSRASKQRHSGRHTRSTPKSSMVGGVVTVQAPQQTSPYLLTYPKSPHTVDRQVSELTMENIISENSASSSHKTDGEESDCEFNTSCSDDSSLCSSLSSASGFLSGEDLSFPSLQHRCKPRKLHRPRRSHHKEGRRGRASRHNRQVAETAQDSHYWMWSTSTTDNHRLQVCGPRRRAPGHSERRRKRPHRHGGQDSQTQANNHEEDQNSSFLFPLQHFTETFHQSPPDSNAGSTKEVETSILVDLTQDLKEIASIAGKSSETLVANIMSHLWEGS